MEFYWITRLDAFNLVLTFFAILFGIALVVLIIITTAWYTEYAHRESWVYEQGKREYKMFKIATIIASVLFAINLVGAVFVPTTKQMCAIYFVEYMQENEDAKQLPDKAIKAANAYFDELIEDKNKTK